MARQKDGSMAGCKDRKLALWLLGKRSSAFWVRNVRRLKPGCRGRLSFAWETIGGGGLAWRRYASAPRATLFRIGWARSTPKTFG